MLGADHTGNVDAHAVQPYYTRLLAEACGLQVVMAAEGEAIVVTASAVAAVAAAAPEQG